MKKIILLVLVLALGLATKVANADFTFGTPTNLGPHVNSSSNDAGPSLSADGMTLFFVSNRPSGEGANDLWMTRRPTTSDPWTEPVNLGSTVNSSSSDSSPSISGDGLSLYFNSGRPGGLGNNDLWVTTRQTVNDPWAPPDNLGPTVNTSATDSRSYMSADGLSLYFTSDRPGGSGYNDLHVTRRATVEDEWGPPVNLGPTVNSTSIDHVGSVSADGLWLFFNSYRSGGFGLSDLYVTTRAAQDDEWGPPVNLGSTVNGSARDASPRISADGRTLYFQSDRPKADHVHDLWQAPIIPIVDFNGDGIVDSDDTRIMIDYWHTNESLCDIGPTPLGDGIVDAQDLLVLLQHLLLEDVSLIAHWKLEETEGIIAHNSINGKHGTVYGDPAWQPEGGIVDGALQLDGIDDYVSTPFVLNPADGKFSVFVWIKGGAPGQVLVSQVLGANWLLVDSSSGNLMTDLKESGRSGKSLLSETVITDGNWHRVGFVWDGAYRALYVDDILVAEDTQTALASSVGGLKIGCGSGPTAGTFFSGLIDDVRIYNRSVSP